MPPLISDGFPLKVSSIHDRSCSQLAVTAILIEPKNGGDCWPALPVGIVPDNLHSTSAPDRKPLSRLTSIVPPPVTFNSLLAVATSISCWRRAMRSVRSEERRVGKECRARWSRYH